MATQDPYFHFRLLEAMLFKLTYLKPIGNNFIGVTLSTEEKFIIDYLFASIYLLLTKRKAKIDHLHKGSYESEKSNHHGC
jgi:hypothetical protein